MFILMELLSVLFKRCACGPGFSGPLCDLEMNECSSRPCKNNGTCVDLSNRLGTTFTESIILYIYIDMIFK